MCDGVDDEGNVEGCVEVVEVGWRVEGVGILNGEVWW